MKDGFPRTEFEFARELLAAVENMTPEQKKSCADALMGWADSGTTSWRTYYTQQISESN